MPKPRDLGANSTNRGLYSRFNMAKLSDKAPPSAAGSTFKGRSSPSSPSVMGRVAPSPKSDTPSKLPRRIFGRPSDGKDTNVSQSNTPTQRRTRATPRSSPQRAHALQPQADVTRSTPDKPLPSLPAARLALESPKKPGRTLLDASELPLRVSPGTPQEGEWPSLSPWRPLTQGAKSSNENLQSSYGGANLNASHNLSTPLPAHTPQPASSIYSPTPHSAAVSKLVSAPGVKVSPPSRTSSPSSSVSGGVSPRSVKNKPSNDSIRSASSVAVPKPPMWSRPKMVEIEGRGAPAAALGAVRRGTDSRRNPSPSANLNGKVIVRDFQEPGSRTNQLPVSSHSATASPRYKTYSNTPPRNGSVARAGTPSTTSSKELPPTPSRDEPIRALGPRSSDFDMQHDGTSSVRTTSDSSSQYGTRIKRLSAFASNEDFGPRLTINPEAEEIIMGTVEDDAVPPPIRRSPTLQSNFTIRRVPGYPEGLDSTPELTEEEYASEGEEDIAAPSITVSLLIDDVLRIKLKEEFGDAYEDPTVTKTRVQDYKSALSILEGNDQDHTDGSEFDIAKLANTLGEESHVSEGSLRERQLSSETFTNQATNDDLDLPEPSKKPVHKRRGTPLSWPVRPASDRSQSSPAPSSPMNGENSSPSGPTRNVSSASVKGNKSYLASTRNSTRTVVPPTASSDARPAFEIQATRGVDGRGRSSSSDSGSVGSPAPEVNVVKNKRDSTLTMSRTSSKVSFAPSLRVDSPSFRYSPTLHTAVAVALTKVELAPPKLCTIPNDFSDAHWDQRSSSKTGRAMANLRTFFHRKSEPKVPAVPLNLPVPKTSKVKESYSASSIPKLASNSSLTRPTASSRARNGTTPQRTPKTNLRTSPPSTTPQGSPRLQGTVQATSSTSGVTSESARLATQIMDQARLLPDNAEKDKLLTAAQVLLDATSSAAVAERSMVQAQQAAREAKICYDMTQASVAEMCRLFKQANGMKNVGKARLKGFGRR